MRIHNISHDDMLNGTGLRVVVWVAGCEHHCPGCQNPITWDENYGLLVTEWEEGEIWQQLEKSYIEGVTFSGGDPLHPCNRKEIGVLARKIKEIHPEKNIWLYTGYEMNISGTGEKYFKNTITGETFTLDWIDCVDVVCDGRFCQDVREKDLQEKTQKHWVGSSNQRVIDVKASIDEIKEVVEL